MRDTALAVRVECYAGHRGETADGPSLARGPRLDPIGEQEPRRFFLGERRVEVEEILDRWLAPDHRYFKLRGDDGGTYILRHDPRHDHWELTLYERGARGALAE